MVGRLDQTNMNRLNAGYGDGMEAVGLLRSIALHPITPRAAGKASLVHI
jgi:hypothetical protein